MCEVKTTAFNNSKMWFILTLKLALSYVYSVVKGQGIRYECFGEMGSEQNKRSMKARVNKKGKKDGCKLGLLMS